jgi:hypothetical protein
VAGFGRDDGAAASRTLPLLPLVAKEMLLLLNQSINQYIRLQLFRVHSSISSPRGFALVFLVNHLLVKFFESMSLDLAWSYSAAPKSRVGSSRRRFVAWFTLDDAKTTTTTRPLVLDTTLVSELRAVKILSSPGKQLLFVAVTVDTLID